MILFVLLFAGISYLLGSIPFSYLAGRILKGVDLRQHGSGNLGATNTYRMLGFWPAFIVGLLDAAKGFLPVHFFPALVLAGAHLYGQNHSLVMGTKLEMVLMIAMALASIAGHVWTLFLGFRGGKGVTTAFGAFVAIAPLATSAALLVWIIVLALGRKVSMASLSAAVAYPIFLLLLKKDLLKSELLLFCFSLVVCALVVYTHRANIARLIRGEEKDIKER